MTRHILDNIPQDSFHESSEPTVAYRLGSSSTTTYDLVELFPGYTYPPHYHVKAQGMVLIVLGEGIININGVERPYKRNCVFYLRPYEKHGFKPESPTLFLSIQSPPVKDPNTGEEDLHFT